MYSYNPSENRRRGVRVSLPVRVISVLVAPGQLVASRVEVLSHVNNSQSLLANWVRSRKAAGELDDVSPVLVEILLELDRKIERLTRPSSPPPPAAEARAVDLSGYGMLLHCEELYGESGYLRLGFELPVFPQAHVELIARVIRSGPRDDAESGDLPYYCAVEYDTVSETHRDHIIGFVLETEREQIRARKARENT